MNINLDGVKPYFQVGYQFVLDQGGKFAHHTVRVLNEALRYIRQDSRLAGVTVAVANILFLETAVRMITLVDKASAYLFGPEEKWSERAKGFNALVVLTMVSSLLVGMNVALYRGLKSPLTPLATTAIGTATCTSYVLLRLWKASGSSSKAESK